MRRPARQTGNDDPVTPDQVFLVEDRGPFTHGVCRSCTWVGPGRRSRIVAASDAELHALAGCEGGEPSGVSQSPVVSQLGDVASGRERLTARGRS